jgi:hypothetical protein
MTITSVLIALIPEIWSEIEAAKARVEFINRSKAMSKERILRILDAYRVVEEIGCTRDRISSIYFALAQNTREIQYKFAFPDNQEDWETAPIGLGAWQDQQTEGIRLFRGVELPSTGTYQRVLEVLVEISPGAVELEVSLDRKIEQVFFCKI